jgi:hypothetical protein
MPCGTDQTQICTIIALIVWRLVTHKVVCMVDCTLIGPKCGGKPDLRHRYVCMVWTVMTANVMRPLIQLMSSVHRVGNKTVEGHNVKMVGPV